MRGAFKRRGWLTGGSGPKGIPSGLTEPGVGFLHDIKYFKSGLDAMTNYHLNSLNWSVHMLFLAVLTVLPATWTKAQELTAVPYVDLNKYAGLWYEIARLPNSFQQQCTEGVTATYTVLDDGTIKVVNRCQKENGEIDEAEGKVKRADGDTSNAKLKVRFAPAILSFLPFVWGNYWVIDLAPDYSYAVVGEPTRKYFWILSRTPALDEGTLNMILDRAKAKGYDLTGLIRTKQSIR
ncbi:MAG TPA: lipocalin family protein [Bacteroidota bacterium]|nr:lipocalin family protein [Bacteroidota bacterium]